MIYIYAYGFIVTFLASVAALKDESTGVSVVIALLWPVIVPSYMLFLLFRVKQ